MTEECSLVVEKVCTTVPKEACHKVESFWSLVVHLKTCHIFRVHRRFAPRKRLPKRYWHKTFVFQWSFWFMKNFIGPGLSKRQGWEVFGQDWTQDQETIGKVEKVVEWLAHHKCIGTRLLTWIWSFETVHPTYVPCACAHSTCDDLCLDTGQQSFLYATMAFPENLDGWLSERAQQAL